MNMSNNSDKEVEIAKINSREKVLIAVISGVVGIITAIIGTLVISDGSTNSNSTSSTANNREKVIPIDQLPNEVKGSDANTSLQKSMVGWASPTA